MKFNLKFSLEKKIIPRDYRRIIISYLKKSLEENKKEYLDKYFCNDIKYKDYTWSLYLGKVQFEDDMIKLDNNEIMMNFSTYKSSDGIIFFNSFMGQLKKSYPFGKENIMILEKIELNQEKELTGNAIKVRINSPIIVKERIFGINRDNYYSFLDEKWEEILKKNLKFQLKDKFDFDASYDIDNLVFLTKNIGTKRTVVSNFGLQFPVTIGALEIKGEKYLLDYFLKAGIGGKRGSGFGMIEII